MATIESRSERGIDLPLDAFTAVAVCAGRRAGLPRVPARPNRQKRPGAATGRTLPTTDDPLTSEQRVDQSQAGISGDELQAIAASLAAALRKDAESIDREEARETVLEVAREAEAAGKERDQSKLVSVLRRARDVIRLFGAGMEDTREVVEQAAHVIHDLTN